VKVRQIVALSISVVSTAALAVVALIPANQASAHGTMSNPWSRVYACKQQNPENPSNAACRAAIQLGGTQPFYDWNEVNQLQAGGNHRAIIPDGRLCSGGRDKYRGLDLARSDWPATPISAGNLTITYHATAPHANSNFEFYITRAGYSPTQPLRWSDLVHLRTFNNQNPNHSEHIAPLVAGVDEAEATCTQLEELSLGTACRLTFGERSHHVHTFLARSKNVSRSARG
jgi:predicted carbohydrate-binding protein with CBM5 and CBM33 domain